MYLVAPKEGVQHLDSYGTVCHGHDGLWHVNAIPGGFVSIPLSLVDGIDMFGLGLLNRYLSIKI
jgi:hypothetical protein